MPKISKWTAESEKLLINIIKDKGNAKTKKWNEILKEFNLKNDSSFTAESIRNKWNKIQKSYKDTCLLMNSSGVGSTNNIFPESVLNEFTQHHPNISLDLIQNNDLNDILCNKIANGQNALVIEEINEKNFLNIDKKTKKLKKKWI